MKTETQKPNQKKSGFSAFLARKNITISAKAYFIDAMGAMAMGLFASLLIGTIISTVGKYTHIPYLSEQLVQIGAYASGVAGPAMAAAIAYALKAPPLVLYSMLAVGYAANALGGAGGPLAVLVIAIVATEIGKAVSKETKIDILVTPLVTILVGAFLSILCAPYIGKVASWIGNLIMWATECQPLIMGVIIAVVVGIALTLPISSAAICAALSLTGLAGGAALAGCCCHMVGFAVISFHENKWGGLVSQGLGTSMLQMPNLVKHPLCWLPSILASAITGPVATCVFRLQMNGAPVSSGMGTCGLVGPIGVITGWLEPSEAAAAQGAAAVTPGVMDWIGLLLVCIVLPATLSWCFAAVMRKLGWIRENDLKLDL